MPTFKFTENQIADVDFGYTPVSKFVPQRVLATNERGYAISTDVTLGSLSNAIAIVDGDSFVIVADSLSEL